jgi:surface antigen
LNELREHNAAVRAAFGEPLRQPVPDALRRQVETMFADAASARLHDDRPAQRRVVSLPMAMAASVAIALAGTLAAFMVLEQRFDQRLARLETSGAADRTYYDNALTVALEDHVSGESVAWINPDTGASGTITPVRTFKAATNDWCREFNTVSAHGGANETQTGIACRAGDGTWQTRVLVFDSSTGPDL